MFSRRASWISVFHHPFLLGSGCFLFILYKLFPSLIVFLVKSSPVIACTALLLGIVLLYGEPNIPEARSRDQRPSNLRNKNKERTKENNAVKRRKNKGMVSKGRNTSDRKDVAREHCDVEQVVAGTVASSSSVSAHNRRKNLMMNKEHSVDKMHQGLTKGGNKNISHAISDKRRLPGIKLHIDRCNFEQCFDSTVGSPWQHVNHHDASTNSESDDVESSSASEADAIPVLHELDPLLDAGAPQPVLVSCYNSDDAGSAAVLQDLESGNDSTDEEAENQDDEDEDDDDEAQEKEDDNKAAVTWTADDQRTLVHLGNSELERNHRVENMIAMRRAWRNEKERNLIELDGNDTLRSAAEMSHFNIQLPSIYAPRSNPFDLPFDSEDIPGSAPSILLPWRNPFDLPYDQVDQNVTVAMGKLNHHEVVAPPIRDMLFRRHESFTIGAPFFGDPNHDRRNYRFKSLFSAERMMGEERIPTDMERQLGEASDMESRTASSLSDHERRRNLQGIESATDHNVEFTDRASKSSEETESVDMVNSSVLDYEKVELVDEDYESNSSVPSEADGNGSKMRISERTTACSHGLAIGLADSSRGIVAPTGIPSKKTGHVPENHITDPVYDSSSSARSNSNISPKGSTGEGSSVGEIVWVAPSLASIDQIESTSREISVIRERDVIGDELSKVHQGFGGGAIMPTLPELAARQSLLYSMSGLSSGRRSSAGS